MLLLDYFYSYNPNGSLKIKPDVIFFLFSAECSVTVVLSVSLQNINITWIEFDFSVDPVFPPQCHLGFFSLAACLLPSEGSGSITGGGTVLPCHPQLQWSRACAECLSDISWTTASQRSRVYKRFRLRSSKWDGNLFFFCLMGIIHYIKQILDDNCQYGVLYWFNSIRNFTSTFCMHLL